MPDESPATPIPSTRLMMGVLITAILSGVLTGSMVNVLLSDIRATFDVSTARISWAITAFSLMYAIGIPLYGRISDFLGTRTLFTLGTVVFALGGLIAATAPTFPLLIVGRLVQGAGGAAVPALGMVMIARAMPPNQRGGAMGMIGAAVGVGQAIGPLVGGLLGGTIGWRFLFLGPMAVSLLVAVAAQRALPNIRLTAERRFDVAGGALLGAAIGLLLFGITQGQSSGYGSALVLASFGGSVVAAAGFTTRIMTARYPFAPPALFRNTPWVRLLLIGMFNMMAYMATVVLVPLMMIEHNGLEPAGAGLVLTPGALAMALVSRSAGRISDRIGPRVPILLGLSIMLVASVGLSSIAAGAAAWVVSLGVMTYGTGSAMINAPLNSAASRLLTAEETGIGMGLLSGATFMGGGIGAAIAGAWLNARQDSASDGLNPLYGGDAAAWSDGFLAVVVIVALALAVAVTIRVARPTAQR